MSSSPRPQLRPFPLRQAFQPAGTPLTLSNSTLDHFVLRNKKVIWKKKKPSGFALTRSEKVYPEEGVKKEPSSASTDRPVTGSTKVAPHDYDPSAAGDQGKLRRLLETALPAKELGGAAGYTAMTKFIELARDVLLDISADVGMSIVPLVGGLRNAAKGVKELAQSALNKHRANQVEESLEATSTAIEPCSRSMAKHLKEQAQYKAALAGVHGASGSANIALTATGVGMFVLPAVTLVGLSAEKILQVRALWKRFEAMERANDFLAQATVDPTHYLNAVEVCPELAAYVLATCDQETICALGPNCPMVGQIPKIKEIANSLLDNSVLSIITCQPSTPSRLFAQQRPALVGGDLTEQVLAQQGVKLITALKRVSSMPSPKVDPTDGVEWQPLPPETRNPAMRLSLVPQAWPSPVPAAFNASLANMNSNANTIRRQPESSATCDSPDAAASGIGYARTALQAFREGG